VVISTLSTPLAQVCFLAIDNVATFMEDEPLEYKERYNFWHNIAPEHLPKISTTPDLEEF